MKIEQYKVEKLKKQTEFGQLFYESVMCTK